MRSTEQINIMKAPIDTRRTMGHDFFPRRTNMVEISITPSTINLIGLLFWAANCDREKLMRAIRLLYGCKVAHF